MPVILATQEAEISRIVVQSQPRQIGDPILKNLTDEVAQGVGPEFKLQSTWTHTHKYLLSLLY
jgi:hypothetical protein